MSLAVRISHERQIRACREVPKLAAVRGYWEVRTYTICDGWVNCWTLEETDGTSKPEVYPTREDAARALREHIADQRIEVEMGCRAEDECDNFDDFQIVFVEKYNVN